MKKENVTTNKVTRKLEKVLWAVLILMFIISVIGMFLGQYQQNVFILEKKWEEICQKHLRSVTG